MSKRAVSSFQVTGWDPSPYEAGPAGGPSLARATVKKKFEGDLTGDSVAELLTCQADPKDLAAGAGYVASERVEGELVGRKGTFVLQHWGVSGGGAPTTSKGHVVPGSGTGALTGLTGTMEISVDADGAHTFTMEYEIA